PVTNRHPSGPGEVTPPVPLSLPPFVLSLSLSLSLFSLSIFFFSSLCFPLFLPLYLSIYLSLSHSLFSLLPPLSLPLSTCSTPCRRGWAAGPGGAVTMASNEWSPNGSPERGLEVP